MFCLCLFLAIQNGRTAATRAIEKGNDDFLKLLIAAGAYADQKDKVRANVLVLFWGALCSRSGAYGSTKGDVRRQWTSTHMSLVGVFDQSESGISWVFQSLHALKVLTLLGRNTCFFSSSPSSFTCLFWGVEVFLTSLW